MILNLNFVNFLVSDVQISQLFWTDFPQISQFLILVGIKILFGKDFFPDQSKIFSNGFFHFADQNSFLFLKVWQFLQIAYKFFSVIPQCSIVRFNFKTSLPEQYIDESNTEEEFREKVEHGNSFVVFDEKAGHKWKEMNPILHKEKT